jgi:hypothetical protein
LIAGRACTNVQRVTRLTLLAVAALALVAPACGQSVPSPQPIELGRSTCAKCRSVIASLDAAAQAAHPDGTARLYDDLGCMATDPVALRGEAQLYVQMAGGKGWARVEDVTFASPPGAKTPQDYNYLAYPEEESRRLAPDHWARGWHDLVSELAKTR